MAKVFNAKTDRIDRFSVAKEMGIYLSLKPLAD